LVSLFLGGYIAGRLGGTFNGWLHGLATWATVTTLTILLLTTAAGGLIGTASGLASFAVNNSDKVSRTELPPAVQQQIDQFTAQARGAPTRPQPKLNKPRLSKKPRRHGKWDNALPRAVRLAQARPPLV
jgi:hypothetical protein